jgi:uridine phosphorylase
MPSSFSQDFQHAEHFDSPSYLSWSICVFIVIHCRAYRKPECAVFTVGNEFILSGQIDHEQGLILPRKRKTDPEIGPDVLMVMIPADLEYLVGQSSVGNFLCLDQGFFKIHKVRREAQNLVAVCGPFLGAPQAVMGMEKIIALGARRAWILGWCGSVQPDLGIGDFVIPIDAVSEEGTSQHYPIGPDKATTDEGLNRIISEGLSNAGKHFRSGTVWTTDAPYRETPSKVARYRNQGVLAVEMEMSALMTLSVYRSVRLASLLVVSDKLSEMKWEAGFRDPRFKEMSRFAADFLFRLLERRVDLQNGIE